MHTRRELLAQTLIAPLAFQGAAIGAPSGLDFIVEDNCLSQESWRGFAKLPEPAHAVILVCGAGTKAVSLAVDLRSRAIKGAWIIWESMPQSPQPRAALRDMFGIELGTPFNPGLYIRYLWPKPALTRSFLQVTPVVCDPSEVVAVHGETPIALRRRIGRGGILFLGSMLGPNLYADEQQAYGIGANLLRIPPQNTILL